MTTKNTELAISDLSTQLLEINKQYGDNLPYSRNSAIRLGKILINQTAESMLQLGNVLIEIKENEPHGEFMKIVEADFNLSSRTARAMMQASAKFLNLSDSKRQTFANLGNSKLFELMKEDDDELEALAEGGTVAGLKLDEIDKLSVRELKAALKESKEAEAALRKISSDKTEKIESLSIKLEKDEKKRKKLNLEVDESAELLATYKNTWLDISKQLNVGLYDAKIIVSKSLNDVLPAHFLQQVAIEISELNAELQNLLLSLPSDTSPVINEDWEDVEMGNSSNVES